MEERVTFARKRLTELEVEMTDKDERVSTAELKMEQINLTNDVMSDAYNLASLSFELAATELKRVNALIEYYTKEAKGSVMVESDFRLFKSQGKMFGSTITCLFKAACC